MSVDALTVKLLDAEEDGWQEVVVTTGGGEEGVTVGQIRVVEETREGPHVWWDAKVVEGDKVIAERRFVGQEIALLAVALRHYDPGVSAKLYAW